MLTQNIPRSLFPPCWFPNGSQPSRTGRTSPYQGDTLVDRTPTKFRDTTATVMVLMDCDWPDDDGHDP